MCLRAVFFIIRGNGGFGIDTGNIIPPVYDVASTDVKVVGDPAVDDLIEPDVIILHGIDVADPGIGAQAKPARGYFMKWISPTKLNLFPFVQMLVSRGTENCLFSV